MSERLYPCGHCDQEFFVTGYAAHVRSCLNRAAAIQAARRPARFPETRFAKAVQIPITLGVRQSKALEETA